MNSLYHKVVIASVCTALSLALGANKEAKAATFTLTPIRAFPFLDFNMDGQTDYSAGPIAAGKSRLYGYEVRSSYFFNIASLSLASNTVITNAFFEGSVKNVEDYGNIKSSTLNAEGYVSDMNVLNSDFSKQGLYLGGRLFGDLSAGTILKFDATTFVNQIVKNNESSVAVRLQVGGNGYVNLGSGHPTTLTITTVDVAEPVPEPTTIFGSALALSLGGWLKRKKSIYQDKTTL